jgi:putative MATE family efflux protein
MIYYNIISTVLLHNRHHINLHLGLIVVVICLHQSSSSTVASPILYGSMRRLMLCLGLGVLACRTDAWLPLVQQRTTLSLRSASPSQSVLRIHHVNAVTGGAATGARRSCRLYTAAVSSSDKDIDNDNDIRNLPKLKRQLTKEFLNIGGPAFVQLAAEPLAALVDTAYLGRLGPEILGGAGVAISAQYAVSKLYNDPLLRTSISLVASQDGKARQNVANNMDMDGVKATKDLSIAVSSALLLAAVVGLVQMVVYAIFCQTITAGMGLTPASPMWHSAVSYLQVRAFGTPAATLWLVANGIFRGLGDTKTPLVYSFMFTALNIVLDPLFIFYFHWGASGAAAGTALAQYAALVPLLLALNHKVKIDILGQLSELGASLKVYLQAGSLVFFRTTGKVMAYAICARQAALLGTVAAAAYNLTFQLGFATTQICEAVAVAVQTLLAREMADTDTHSPAVRSALVRHLIHVSIVLGGGVATVLSVSTWWRRDAILASLTSSKAVQAAAAGIFPAVLTTQVLKGFAYPVNGIIMGGLDWVFTMLVMWLANFACVGLIRGFAQQGGGLGVVSLGQIWWALAAFMGTQVVAGILRVHSKTGVWKVLKKQQDISS